MPTYDYQCTAGHNFEKIHKMSETPRVKCPTCGKPAARQISGGAGLVFKGSGFYITDYGKDGKGARKAETGESSGSVAAKSDASGSDAPAKNAKAESKTTKESTPKSSGGSKKAAE
ncbi:MAG: zinc ribbon domain-containing protein [Gemmatimonadales bacterium]|jgi:putative FmdB family regulatory protein|nr:MAG: zinc ribbon domain-containing protein [Gemmatimonadales bacterium]